MKAFATLLDRLVYAPSRQGKLTLLKSYFRGVPDPDRGYALAAFTDGLPLSFPLRRILAALAESRFDAELFRLSRDYVGDTAETVSLIWPSSSASAFSTFSISSAIFSSHHRLRGRCVGR